MLRTNHESGESSSSMSAPLSAISSGPSRPPPTLPVAGRIEQMATRFEGSHNKRRWALTVLDKHEICKKRIESKENERMKLDEFARLFPGMCLNSTVLS